MIRDKRCCLRLGIKKRIMGRQDKGGNVRFWGYWVSSERNKIEVTAGEFDETELSDHSDWKEAWQNEDPEYPHGYLDPLTMLHDISKKIAGEIGAADLEDAAAKFREGTPFSVNDLEALARLIQLLVPKALPRPAKGERPTYSLEDGGDDIPFDGN
jgi:hypothetical protein